MDKRENFIKILSLIKDMPDKSLDGTVTELLEVFDLEGNPLGFQEREKFYAEIKEQFARDGKITRQVKSIRALLLNPSGRVYLQKRSLDKSENPGLYDKSVGGHVLARISYELTLVKECAEELGLPAAISTPSEFDAALRSIDLRVIGIFRQVDYIAPFLSSRVDRGSFTFTQPFMSAFFIGYYDGPIRFADGESTGIEVFSLDQLRHEITINSTRFTEDLKVMVERYSPYIVPLKRP